MKKSSKCIRICYILPHFYPYIGGSEQAFLNLILNLKKEKKVEIRVVTSSHAKVKNIYSYLGIDIYRYPWKDLFGQPLVRKKDLYEHIKWADVVHTAVYSPVIPTSKICRKLRTPCIITVHESLNQKWYWVEKNKLKAFLFRTYEKLNILTKCDLFHVPSEATKKDLQKNHQKAKIQRIYWISDKKFEKSKPNRISLADAFEIEPDSTIFLYYGRPGQTKGIFVYEEAIRILMTKLNDCQRRKVKFCFSLTKYPACGFTRFQKNIDKYHLSDVIKINDHIKRDQLLNYISITDYVVVPSITEGFGLAALEACERGAKLIHSDGGSLPEVTYGKCVSFENRNSIDLANKLFDIINGKDIFIEKEEKDFTKVTITNQFYDMYRDVLKKHERKYKN